MRKKELFQLIGQSLMMLVAVICGGGVMAMAAPTGTFTNSAPGVEQGNTPEAEVTNPIQTTRTEMNSTTQTGSAVFPEQSVTSVEAAKAANSKVDVYEDQYDELISKVRIARTPIDQISRRSRRSSKVKNMEFRYGSIDYLPIETTTSAALTESSTTSDYTSDSMEAVLKVNNASLFNRRDIIIVKGVNGYKPNSATADTGVDLKLWVLDRNGNTELKVIAVNGKKIGTTYNQIPTIASGTTLIRVAKACAELDSQAPGYSILPTSDEQFCQKFMAQVEQSTIDALTAKRFNITLNDQEEATLADMRLGMEGVFLFGTRGKIIDPETRRNVWFTGGIWNTEGLRNLTWTDSSSSSNTSPLGVPRFINWAKSMFTGPAAGKSDKRVVICGSALLEGVQNALFSSQYATNTFKKWDLEFTEFKTVFGSFEFILDEVFDLHVMPKCGLILDPDYLERYVFEPFGRNTLDLDAQGTRDSKAIVLREISAMVLKSPNNHARIIYS